MALYLLNSLFLAVGSTVVVMLLAIPAAYALSVRPIIEVAGRAVLLHLHQVHAASPRSIIPVFLLLRTFGLLDNLWALGCSTSASTCRSRCG